MSRRIMTNQNLVFSVLFPEVHQMVFDALTRQFPVLHLSCVRTLLSVCAENLTRYLIALPDHRGANTPYLNLMELKGVTGERIEDLIFHWRNKMSMFDDADVARTAYPKVFEFVQDQILLKESNAAGLSENDIAALTMILVKSTFVFYKGKKEWLFNRSQVRRTLEHWFTAEETN